MFSVIIPTKAYDHLLEVAISETLNLYPKLEIIIISDTYFDDDRVIVLSSRSKNLSDKRNQGVEYSKKPYIIFLDSDAYPHKGWLEACYEFLEKTSQVGIVGGPNLVYKRLNYFQQVQECAYQSPLVNNEPSSNISAPVAESILSSSNFAFHRDTFLKIGKMNTNIFTGEDIELCYRFENHGFSNYFHPNMKVSHKQRNLIGFVKQRFVWGRGVFTVLRYTFPNYLSSIIPLIGILLQIFFFLLNLKFFFALNLLFVILCFIESLRVSHFKLDLSFKVFPFIYLSLFSLGFGSLFAIFFGDINNNFSMYDNHQ